MLIVLEGVDGAGKTTLAEALGGRYVHHSQPKGHPLEDYERELQYHLPEDELLVVDRLHWGEMVYGPLYRGESRLGWPGFMHVEMLLQARGAVRVLVGGDPRTIRRRLEERGEDFLRLEHLEEVMEGFEVAHSRAFERKVRVWPATPTDTADLAGWLRHQAVAEARRAEGLPLRYLGAPDPHVLLVGDQRSDPTGWCQVPFAPLPGGCGAWLLGALPAAWVGRLGIINANECEDLRSLWVGVGRPLVVALGNEAAARLGEAGIACGKVPHPQYGRRFAPFNQDGYALALALASEGRTVRPEEITPWR